MTKSETETGRQYLRTL